MSFTSPLIPLDERERLLELRDLGILDTEPDEDYDRLVQLATVLCGTPMGAQCVWLLTFRWRAW